IQPILDTAAGKGCTNVNCHGSATPPNGFKMIATPAKDSADMHANFDSVTKRCDTTNPQQSKVYGRAMNVHASGNSAVVTPAQGQTILDWITAAKQVNNNAPSMNQPLNCPDPSNFNAGVFQKDIEPILFGTLDLNNRGSQTLKGCSLSTCHGQDRGTG